MSNIVLSATKEMEELENSFKVALQQSMLSMKEAGDLFLKIWEKGDDNYKEKFKLKYRLSPTVISTLLNIGKGTLLPDLAAYPNRFKKLPLDDQRKIIEKKVTALILKPDGNHEEIIVDVLTAPRELVDQVIAPDHIRSMGEQRARLISVSNRKLAMKEASKKEVPWKVIPGNKVIIGGVTLTLDEMLVIVQAIRSAR